MKRYLMAAAVLLPLLISCREKAGDAGGEAARAVAVAEKNVVDTMVLRRVPFSREIVSNGVLEGARRAELSLRGAVLRAPFSGIVANLAAKPWEQASGVVCLVIDDSTLDHL